MTVHAAAGVVWRHDVLTDTDYVDRKGRRKRVTYWEMRPIDAGRFRPNQEVDEIRWVAVHAAERLLTYAVDGPVATCVNRRTPSVISEDAPRFSRHPWS